MRASRTKRKRKSETRIGLIKASKQCWMPPMAQQRVVSQITVRHVAHRCASNAEQCPIHRSARRHSLYDHPRSLYPVSTGFIFVSALRYLPPCCSRIRVRRVQDTLTRYTFPLWTITPCLFFTLPRYRIPVSATWITRWIIIISKARKSIAEVFRGLWIRRSRWTVTLPQP